MKKKVKRIRDVLATLLAIFIMTMFVVSPMASAKYANTFAYKLNVIEEDDREYEFTISPEADRFSIIGVGATTTTNSIQENIIEDGVTVYNVARIDARPTVMTFVTTTYDLPENNPPDPDDNEILTYIFARAPYVSVGYDADHSRDKAFTGTTDTAIMVDPEVPTDEGRDNRTTRSPATTPIIDKKYSAKYPTGYFPIGKFTVDIPSDYIGEITVTVGPSKNAANAITFKINVDTVENTITSTNPSNLADPALDGANDGNYNEAKFFVDDVCWRVLSHTMGTIGQGDGFNTLVITEHAYKTKYFTPAAPDTATAFRWHSGTLANGYNNSPLIRSTLRSIYQNDLDWAYDYAVLPSTTDTSWTGNVTNFTTTTNNTRSSGNMVKAATDPYLNGCFLLSAYDVFSAASDPNSPEGFGWPAGSGTAAFSARKAANLPNGTAVNIWLRSSYSNANAHAVYSNGTNFNITKSTSMGVRPAMLLRLPFFGVSPKSDRFSIVGADNTTTTNTIKENFAESKRTIYNVATLSDPTEMTFVTTARDRDYQPIEPVVGSPATYPTVTYAYDSGAPVSCTVARLAANGPGNKYSGNRNAPIAVGEFNIPIPANYIGVITVTVNAPSPLSKTVTFWINVNTVPDTVMGTTPSSDFSGRTGTAYDAAYAASSKFFVENVCWRVLSHSMGAVGNIIGSPTSGYDTLVISEHAYQRKDFLQTSSFPWHSANTVTYADSNICGQTLVDIFENELAWAHEFAVLPVTTNALNGASDPSWFGTANYTNANSSPSYYTNTKSAGAKVPTTTGTNDDFLYGCFLLSARDVFATAGTTYPPPPPAFGWTAVTTPSARKAANLPDGTPINLWLRSSSGIGTNSYARAVYSNGSYYDAAANTKTNSLGIRPAMILRFPVFSISAKADRFSVSKVIGSTDSSNEIRENFVVSGSTVYNVASLPDAPTVMTFVTTTRDVFAPQVGGDLPTVTYNYDGGSEISLTPNMAVAYVRVKPNVTGIDNRYNAPATPRSPYEGGDPYDVAEFEIPIPADYTGEINVTVTSMYFPDSPIKYKLNVRDLKTTVLSTPQTSGITTAVSGNAAYDAPPKFFVDDYCWRVLSHSLGRTGHGSGTDTLILSEHCFDDPATTGPLNDGDDRYQWNSADSGFYRDSTIRKNTLMNIYKNNFTWAHTYAVLPVQDASWTSNTANGSRTASTGDPVPTSGVDEYLDGCFLLSYYELFDTANYGWPSGITGSVAGSYRRAAVYPDGYPIHRMWLRASYGTTTAEVIEADGSTFTNKEGDNRYKSRDRWAVRPAMILRFPPGRRFSLAPLSDRFMITNVSETEDGQTTNTIQENTADADGSTVYNVASTGEETTFSFVTTMTPENGAVLTEDDHKPAVTVTYENGAILATDDVDITVGPAMGVDNSISDGSDNRIEITAATVSFPIPAEYDGTITVTAGPTQEPDKAVTFTLNVRDVRTTVMNTPASGDAVTAVDGDAAYNAAKLIIDDVCWRVLSHTMGEEGYDSGADTLILSEHAFDIESLDTKWRWDRFSSQGGGDTLGRIYETLPWAHDYAVLPVQDEDSWVTNNNADAQTKSSGLPVDEDQNGCFLLSIDDVHNARAYGWPSEDAPSNAKRTSRRAANLPDGTPVRLRLRSGAASAENTVYTVNSNGGATVAQGDAKEVQDVRPAMLLRFDAEYTVRYCLEDTEEELYESKTAPGQVGVIVIEEAADIEGYIVDEAAKSLKLKPSGNEIIFYYHSEAPEGAPGELKAPDDIDDEDPVDPDQSDGYNKDHPDTPKKPADQFNPEDPEEPKDPYALEDPEDPEDPDDPDGNDPEDPVEKDPDDPEEEDPDDPKDPIEEDLEGENSEEDNSETKEDSEETEHKEEIGATTTTSVQPPAEQPWQYGAGSGDLLHNNDGSSCLWIKMI